MHEYSAYEPRPHLFTAVIIIWQGRMVILRLLAYRSSKTKTPDKYVFSVIYTACARGDTQACAWSRALTTAWSRAYCAITIIINGV